MKHHLLGILLAVAVCFGAQNPTQAQNTKDLVDRLNTSLGVSLPTQYQTTVKNFIKNSKILSDKDAQTFTEKFIKDQMKSNWGINKQNQLLFVWDAVYGQIITNKQLYTGEDGNQTRLAEFEKVMEKAEACGKKYHEGFKAYMRQLSAEADRRIAEADRRIAEANRRIARSLRPLGNKETHSQRVPANSQGVLAQSLLGTWKLPVPVEGVATNLYLTFSAGQKTTMKTVVNMSDKEFGNIEVTATIPGTYILKGKTITMRLNSQAADVKLTKIQLNSDLAKLYKESPEMKKTLDNSFNEMKVEMKNELKKQSLNEDLEILSLTNSALKINGGDDVLTFTKTR